MIPDSFSKKIYWLNKLGGDLPKTRILAKSGGTQEKRYQTLDFVLPAGLSRKITAFTQNSAISLYIFLLACLDVVLYKYTGEADLVTGSPVLQQGSVQAEGFVPIRLQIGESTSVKDILSGVRESVLGAYAHQDFPLADLGAHWNMDISPDGASLFQIAVLLDPIHAKPSTDALGQHLVFAFCSEKGLIRGAITFDSSSYDTAFMEAAIGHFQKAAAAILCGPETKLAAIEILSEEERQSVLSEFNSLAMPFPISKTLHQLFREQVQKGPERIAIRAARRQVSYRELSRLAARLRSLLPQKDCAGRFIGILQERGIDFLASMLAILESGSAFLPIDPAYPVQRINYMINHSDISLLLAQKDLIAGRFAYLRDSFPGKIIYPDDFWSSPADCYPPELQENSSDSDPARSKDAAYMIYTSGSTGKPKGAMIRHDGVINHIFAKYESLKFNQDSCFVQTAPCSSDIVIWQYLAPVLIGGRVVVANDQTARDPRLLLACMQTEEVTHVELVPAVLKVLVAWAQELPSEQRLLPCLKWMIVTGEAVPASLVNDWLRLYPEIPVANCYGPTEASDDVTQANIYSPLADDGCPVSIGKPLANIDIFILNRDMQPVPIGVPGELCVAGVAAGGGYWKDPEHTARSFINNPFRESKGPVIYRTGDLARWYPNGEIEFLGRIDHQVKIRGVRIEKSEIEAVLLRHPAVKEALVGVCRVRGENSLVAYWVSGGIPPASETELREHLEKYLPGNMVPSGFVRLEKFPLTANGKINLKALPEPQTLNGSEQPAVARTPIEELLAGIWMKLLDRDSIGIHEDFFAAGGHSLLATAMASQVRDIFRIELPLRTIFEMRTIAQLAACIVSAQMQPDHFPAPPLLPQPRPANIPLSFAQQRLWFIDKLTPGLGLYNIPAGVHLQGAFDVTVLQWAIAEMVKRHEILRTSFSSIDGNPVQVIHGPFQVPIRQLNLQHLPAVTRDTELLRRVEEEINFPFELAQAPLLRILLIRVDADEHVLLITLHHIISDGWSTAIFVRELCELYRRFLAREEGELPELPIQYADFALWQRNWLSGDVLKQQLAYWKTQLRLPLPQLALPVDFQRAAQRTYAGAVEVLALPGEDLRAIHEFCRKHGITPFMAMLAAFQILLHRYSGHEDIIVGADIANRNRTETEGLIGFFVNMLVLRIDLSGDPTIEELLGRVRQVALDAYTHQDLPFEKIVTELQPDRNLSQNPIFQVVIVLQNMLAQEPNVAGVSIRPFELPRRWAKFDLILTLEESDGGLSTSMEYSTDLFRQQTIRRMLEHYRGVLVSMMLNTNQRLSDIPVLSQQELETLYKSPLGAQFNRKDLESIVIQAGS